MRKNKDDEKEYAKSIISGLVSGVIIFFGIQSVAYMQLFGYNVLTSLIFFGLAVGLSLVTAVGMWPIYRVICNR